MARLTGFEPATFGSGVIGAWGINNLHRVPPSATELYFQRLKQRVRTLGNTPSMQGVPTNLPTSF